MDPALAKALQNLERHLKGALAALEEVRKASDLAQAA